MVSAGGLLGSANIFHQLPGREGETQPQQKKTGFVETSNIFQLRRRSRRTRRRWSPAVSQHGGHRVQVTGCRSQGAGHRETLNVVVTYFKYTEIHLSLFLHVFSYRDWSRSLTDVWQRRGVMVRRSLCWVWWPELRATGRRLLSFMRKLWTVTRTMKSTCVLCASCAWSCSESADAELELQAQDRRGCSWLIKCWFFPHVSVSLKAAFSHLCLCGDEEKRKLSRLWCIRVL